VPESDIDDDGRGRWYLDEKLPLSIYCRISADEDKVKYVLRGPSCKECYIFVIEVERSLGKADRKAEH
jgi:hypothetical protein